MNVLIINLTRFGDLLQTQPVVAGFREQGARVGLVCVENFAFAANFLQGVDEVFSFSGARILAALDANWREAVQLSRNLVAQAETFKPDLVVNLTPSVSARLLARKLCFGAPVQGFRIDEHGFNADTTPWAAFLQVAGGNRGASPFNVCDLFRRTAGLSGVSNELALASPGAKDSAEADELLSRLRPEGMHGYVALQPGASEDRRRWPVERFAELADRLWNEERLVPIILGTKSESNLGKRISEAVTCPVLSLQGSTSLPVLAAVLRRCAGLVTNDTGTMHLAAGMGTPISAIFLATAQPWDTGPYCSHAVCLEPDMDCHPCRFGKPCLHGERCRYSVETSAVLAALKTAMGRKGASFEGCRAWQSEFDRDGLLGLRSLSGHEHGFRFRWITIQRELYRRFLDGESFEDRAISCRGLDESDREKLLTHLEDGTDMLFLLARQVELLAKNPRQALKAKFMAGWERFHQILQSDERLNVLGSLWNFESHQYGGDLHAVSGLIVRYHALLKAFIECV